MKIKSEPHSRFVSPVRLCLLTITCAMLAACAVGPDYQRPTLDVGAVYKEAALANADGQLNKGWVQARADAATLRSDWWVLFDDPVLTNLMHVLQVDNVDIAQAEAQYRQAQALLQSARSGLFPVVGASGSGTRSGGGTQNVGTSGGPSNQYQLGGTVSWEPDLWGEVRRSVEANQAGVQASAADVANVRLSMQSTLAQTYFNLRFADAQQRLLHQTVDVYERSFTTTQNRLAAGVAAQADVEVSRTQLENARAQLLALAWQRAQYEHAIAVLQGLAPSQFSLAETRDVLKAPVVPVGVPAQLLQRRPDVAAAERRTAEANARIGVAQAAWFPDLTLSAQGGFRSAQWAQLLTAPAQFWSLGPALALTIFDGGARQAQLDEARAAYDAQTASYRQTVLTALREVEDYLVQLAVMAQQQVAQGRALAAARESLRLTQNQYDAGLIDYLSVVQVQTTALNAEQSALSLQSDRLAASVLLIAALGGGWDVQQLDEAATPRQPGQPAR
ncbi:efflux transporter outer membrane subunit [Allopusillimonas ginsengisoli]|nr:efflux transporter outer membrane subunit [Allopusillimonas ginsengisoli]